jgi:Tfp pilus assembly major pilin PilA
MLNAIKKFFKGTTVDESYANGLACARNEIAGTTQPKMKAKELYELASGGFGDTDYNRAYDRGVRDGLQQLGYSDPF